MSFGTSFVSMSIVIVFIIVLGALIFVHELGHFLMARRSGMKVEEFGFGFPPRLGGFVWNEEKKRHVFIAGNKIGRASCRERV